jgi:hypothetical protein
MGRMLGIITEIIGRVVAENDDYRTWRMGLTNDVGADYERWNRPSCFLYWEAPSLRDARLIESFFVVDKGMQGAGTDGLKPDKKTYVCIF